MTTKTLDRAEPEHTPHLQGRILDAVLLRTFFKHCIVLRSISIFGTLVLSLLLSIPAAAQAACSWQGPYTEVPPPLVASVTGAAITQAQFNALVPVPDVITDCGSYIEKVATSYSLGEATGGIPPSPSLYPYDTGFGVPSAAMFSTPEEATNAWANNIIYLSANRTVVATNSTMVGARVGAIPCSTSSFLTNAQAANFVVGTYLTTLTLVGGGYCSYGFVIVYDPYLGYNRSGGSLSYVMRPYVAPVPPQSYFLITTTTTTYTITACPAHASGTPCVCDAGYELDAAGTSCVSTCPVLPLTTPPFNEVCAEVLENLSSTQAQKDAACGTLTPAMQTGQACLEGKLAAMTPSIPFVITAGVRSVAYQAHFREIWDKMQVLVPLMAEDTAMRTACADRRAEIAAEKGCDNAGKCTSCYSASATQRSHCLKGRPANPSSNDAPHTQGNAIDVSMAGTIDPLRTALGSRNPPQTIPQFLDAPTDCKLIWGGTFDDPVHFQVR